MPSLTLATTLAKTTVLPEFGVWGTTEARFAYNLTRFIDVPQLPANLDLGQPFGEILRTFKLWSDYDVTSLIYVAPAITDLDRSQSFTEFPAFLELGCNN
jgi:hypothetical protein